MIEGLIYGVITAITSSVIAFQWGRHFGFARGIAVGRKVLEAERESFKTMLEQVKGVYRRAE